MERWDLTKVWSLAPDAASRAAATKLAGSAAIWSDTGTQDSMIWGSVQGSGKNPYRVLVDTTGPRYKCSCPSRKFPCKHALALLSLWSTNQLATDLGQATSKPADTQAWEAKQSGVPVAKSTSPPTPEQLAAAIARRAQREERIAGGLEELEQWLTDQLDNGLARSRDRLVRNHAQTAARMIDAQAPGIAKALLNATATAFRADSPDQQSNWNWVGKLLQEYSLLHLAAKAWPQRDSLPADLAQTLRTVVGLTIGADEITATGGKRGRWLVAGLRDITDDKIVSRRVWLHALDPKDAPWISVVTHTPSGQAPDVSLAPGTIIEAMVHHYPGSGNYRALLSARYAVLETSDEFDWRPPIHTFAELVTAHRDLLTANPWAEVSPASIRIRTIFNQNSREWRAQDDDGRQATLLGNDLDLWRLHGLLHGEAGQVLGEWSPNGLLPTSLVTETGLELL